MDALRNSRWRYLLLAVALAAGVVLLQRAGLPAAFVLGVSSLAGFGLLVFLVWMQDPAPIFVAPTAADPKAGPPRESAATPAEIHGKCHACGEGDLEICVRIERRGVPHGQDGHHFMYHTKDLFRCARCLASQLHMSDHDCFSSYDADDRLEEWDMHWTYSLSAEGTKALVTALAALCPDLLDPRCSCAGHEGLRASKLAPGRWRVSPVALRIENGAPTLESVSSE